MKKMKKSTLTLLAVAFATTLTYSQTVEDGIKKLYYLRIRESVEILEKVVAAKPTDPYATYWLGQAYLKVYSLADNKEALKKTKKLNKKSLNAGVNEQLISVGR